MIRILVTGSRHWPEPQAVWGALDRAATGHDRGSLTVVTGDCPTGADHAAARWALGRGVQLDVFYADWQRHGKAAGPLRNGHMVDSGADLCLAFPFGRSPGTRGCMRLAEAAGIPVEVIEP